MSNLNENDTTLVVEALRFYAAHWGAVGASLRKGSYVNPSNNNAIDAEGRELIAKAERAREVANRIEAT